MNKNKKNSNKKSRILNIFSKIVGIIYLIVYILSVFLLIKLDVLPNKYLIPFLIISILFSIILLLILLIKKIKWKIKIIFSIVSILLIIICCFGSYYLYSTINFMNNIDKNKTEYEEYYVVVKNKSSYKSLKDIKNSNIYILNSSEEKYMLAQKKLSKKINITYKNSNSIEDLFKKVNDNNIIFISSNIYSILSESNYNINKFTKIISTIKIKSKKQEITKSVNVSNSPFNIYISGTDTSGSISRVARSDVNMVATINPINHEILLTSIPRDYYVKLHTSGSYDKLTHSGIYGINETVTTIEDLLQIDINYYVQVNFTTVIKLVDVIGGITINSDYAFTTHGMGKKYTFVKGINNLNGEQALAFARERKSFKDGDRQRVKNQQIILSAIIQKVSKSSTILSKYNNILNSLNDSLDTNINSNDFKLLIKKQINDMSDWNIEKISLLGIDSRAITYTYGVQNLYVMKQDDKSVLEAINKINGVLKK